MLTEHDLQSRIFHYFNEIEMYKGKEHRATQKQIKNHIHS